MAYEYFKLQANEMLNNSLSNDIIIGNISINMLYNISENEFLIFAHDFMRPLLHVYGVDITIDASKGKEIKEHLVKVGEYSIVVNCHDKIDFSFYLKFKIVEVMNDYGCVIIDICNNRFYNVDIDLLLDPISFFGNQKDEDYADRILQIIHDNITRLNQMFWVVGCVCDMHLVLDLVVGIRCMVLELLVDD